MARNTWLLKHKRKYQKKKKPDFGEHLVQRENDKPFFLFQTRVCYHLNLLCYCNHQKAGGVSFLVITITLGGNKMFSVKSALTWIL